MQVHLLGDVNPHRRFLNLPPVPKKKTCDVQKQQTQHGSASSSTQLPQASNYFAVANLPKSLQLLWNNIRNIEDTTVVTSLHLNEQVLGVGVVLMIMKDDIEQFLEMREIGSTILIVYMRLVK